MQIEVKVGVEVGVEAVGEGVKVRVEDTEEIGTVGVIDAVTLESKSGVKSKVGARVEGEMM